MERIYILLLFVFSFSLGKTQTELVDFESTPQFVTIDSLTGCWQIGTPSKTIFDTAYSASHALMTDTINAYPDGTLSYAYFTFPLNSFSSSYTLKFKHRYDTELAKDGGYIELYDCWSSTWINISSGPMACSPYGSSYSQNNPTINLQNNVAAYSGTTNGWIETEIGFFCMALIQNGENRGGGMDAQLRFVFESDGTTTNQEGWMIDDIIWNDQGGVCSGIEEYKNQIQLSVYPTLTDNKITFETESEKFSQISIYDFSGKLVETFNFQPSNFKTLQLSNYVNGMYFYSIDNGKANGKFIVEN